MTTNQIIEKAIEGGYSFQNELYSKDPTAKDFVSKETLYKALLDPPFWWALVSAMGWADVSMVVHYYLDRVGGIDLDIDLEAQANISSAAFYQHQLINHIDDGGTIESYFEQL